MKLIGLTSSSTDTRMFVNTAYHNAFRSDRSIPVALPIIMVDNDEDMTKEKFYALNKATIDAYVQKLDGLVLTGGIDVNPLSTADEENWASSHCDTSRDFTESALINGFLEAEKPIMGICRGFQLLLNHFGLPYYHQDLASMKIQGLHNSSEREFKDRQEPAHTVVLRGELLNYCRDIYNNPNLVSIRTNSFHHQGFTLNDDGSFPNTLKHAKPEAFRKYLEDLVENLHDVYAIDVLGHTNLVLESFQMLGGKIFGVQYHPEEYGSKSAAIRYWMDKNFNV